MKRLLLSISAALCVASAVLAQQTLAVDAPVTATFEGTPVDVFINGAEGESVLIEGVAANADLALEVYDPNNNYVAGDDNSGGDSNPTLGVTFNQSGQYRVSVLTYVPTTQTSDFTLTVTPLEVITQAPLALGQTVRSVTGEVFSTFDITLDRDTTVLFSLLTYNFPPRITLTDSAGNVISTSETNVLLASLTTGAYQIRLEPSYESEYGATYYAVSLEETTITPLAYGEPITRDDSGKRASFFTFEATADDIIDLTLESANPVTSGAAFTVYGPDNFIAFYSESSSTLTYLRAAQVLETGTYRVEVTPFAETFAAPYVLSLSTSERVVLGGTALQVAFDVSRLSDNYAVSVEAGKIYRLTITTDNSQRPVNVFVQNIMTQVANVSLFGGTGVSVDFVAVDTTTYTVNVRVDASNYDDQGQIIDTDVANLTFTFEEVVR